MSPGIKIPKQKVTRLWVMTLLEYDEYNNPTILKSFNKPAKDSPTRKKKMPKRLTKDEKMVKSMDTEQEQEILQL